MNNLIDNTLNVSPNGTVMATINLETIAEMYYNKLTAINESLADPRIDHYNKGMLTIKQSEIIGAITALGKVREMEQYNNHHDELANCTRLAIVERVTTIR